MRQVIANEDLAAKAQEFLELQFELERLEVAAKTKRMEVLKKDILEAIDDGKVMTSAVDFGNGVWGDLMVTVRRSLDVTALKIANPEVYGEFLRDTRARTLKVQVAQDE